MFRYPCRRYAKYPQNQQMLIAANHCSHLDYGTLRFALDGRVLGYLRWQRRTTLMKAGKTRSALDRSHTVMRQGSFASLSRAQKRRLRGRRF